MIDVINIPPLQKLCITIGQLPASYLASMTFEEQLLWLCNYLEKTVIPAIDNNAQALEEVQELFVILKNYVDNYFDNLDVQDEINNKLDEMAEDGTLQEIITAYLQVNGVLAFDNVSSMKTATNLMNGSFAETFGFYNKNDGGNAKYKIRTLSNDDIIDEKYIIALNDNTLIAELIIDSNFNILQIGAKKDDETFDNTLILAKAFEKSNKIYIPTGYYYCLTSLVLESKMQIIGEMSTLHYLGNGYFINKDSNSEISRVSIQNLFIKGNENQNNGIYIRGFIDSNIENVRIFDFNIGIKSLYTWDSIFKSLRVHNCLKPMELGSQFNNCLFENCSFSTFTTQMSFTNCEDITFLNCDITNCTEKQCITLFQSSLKLLSCYFENLRQNRTIVGGYNESTHKSILEIDGGKVTDTQIEVDMYNGELFLGETYVGKIIPVSHKSSDKQAVGDLLRYLSINNRNKPTPYNSLIYFDGTQNPELTYYQTTDVTKVVENGLLKITINDNNSTKNAGLRFNNLTQDKNYLLILEGKFAGQDTSQSILFQEFNGGSYSVRRSFETFQNKMIIPFYAFSSDLYLRWAHTEALELSKFILMQLD